MSGGGRRVGQADANAVNAAVGAGQDFKAEAVFFYDFSGQGDVAGNLGDEAAERSGFVVLGQAKSGGIVTCVAGGTVETGIVRIGAVRMLIAQGVIAKIAGPDVAEVVLLGGI
jgi:hypothetical protein